MKISAKLIKELREKTAAGMMDCKKALEEAEGNMEKAIEILRKKGLSDAAKKTGRITAEGVIDAYIHGNGRIGVLVEVNCETDFVAKNEKFKKFVKEIAMQIAAQSPLYVSREDIPESVMEKEKSILKAQAENEGKPQNVVDKIVEGRLEKYFQNVCLLEQPYIRDTDKTVKELLLETISVLGENITIRRFVRYELGEGLEKKENNFVDEVMAQIKKD